MILALIGRLAAVFAVTLVLLIALLHVLIVRPVRYPIRRRKPCSFTLREIVRAGTRPTISIVWRPR